MARPLLVVSLVVTLVLVRYRHVRKLLPDYLR
jgi:hypothetical protein